MYSKDDCVPSTASPGFAPHFLAGARLGVRYSVLVAAPVFAIILYTFYLFVIDPRYDPATKSFPRGTCTASDFMWCLAFSAFWTIVLVVGPIALIAGITRSISERNESDT